jgi:hypothetical protein
LISGKEMGLSTIVVEFTFPENYFSMRKGVDRAHG